MKRMLFGWSMVLMTAVGVMVVGAQEPKKDAPNKETPRKETPKKESPKDNPKKDPPKKKDPQPPKKVEATPASLIAAPPGFKVELLHTADPSAEGSWINLCTETNGRLIIGGQRNQALLRAHLKDGKVERMEKLDLGITECMGLLYAYDSLYVNGAGPMGFGLYRFKHDRQKDKYGSGEFLKRFDGAGEHGPHGLAVGPDKKIYVMNGNHTKLPEQLASSSPHKNYREDHILPRQWDGNGHAAGILSPGGYVVRTDADGKDWELVLAGFRNAYDIAFNGDGEVFTFDSDMEWDWGTPWYRPTRVNHCVSGAEFGWRSGTGKWPDHYIDSLPATVDIGIGSPTGVCFGTGAKFPAKYQRAYYICDWSYGRLIAVHLKPKGSTYVASYENFIAPLGLVKEGEPKRPLNLTDVVIGEDGALYFTIGGRNTQGALYRVTYTGSESTAPADLTNADGKAERALRHSLEAFHGRTDPKAVEAAWPHLGHADRFIRFAARVAIEHQPVGAWKAKALAETSPTAGLTGLCALARSIDSKELPELMKGLERFKWGELNREQRLDKLRVLQIAFSRHGRPAVDSVKRLMSEIDGQFPTADAEINRELVQVLVFLHAPGVVGHSLDLMAKTKSQEEMLHYLFQLRTLPIGNWTMEQRKTYFGYWTADRKKYVRSENMTKWFREAGRPYADGNSMANFMRNFLREASSNLSDAERKELAPVLAAIDKASVEAYEIKPRAVVKQWKMDELLPMVADAPKGRSFSKGREAYFASQCIKCHRFANEGGSIGPDLTSIASRFTRKDILESILDPSKVLSDQYQNEQFTTKSGKVVTGRVVDESKEKLVVQPDPLSPNRVEIAKDDLEARTPSKLSPMPTNLVDVLTKEEILDLIAYLESQGSQRHPAFKK